LTLLFGLISAEKNACVVRLVVVSTLKTIKSTTLRICRPQQLRRHYVRDCLLWRMIIMRKPLWLTDGSPLIPRP